MNLHADAAQRLAIYKGLMVRNRLISILRIGVPALGVIALLALLGQIYISSLASRFGIGRIEVTRENVTVDSPQYTGTLDDGTAYTVSATEAQAPTNATNRIALSRATLETRRPNGDTSNVEAEDAILDTALQIVEIRDEAQISDSAGTTGTIVNSIFDYAAQFLRGEGPVAINHADGTTIIAEGITYDAENLVWTFTRATVTLPDTPGAATAGTDATEMQTP
ncbi:MAG: hypothetical protein P0Y65_17315 [Candidatus Devosia phytovorans]|uniref:LPS export ABC transporter periplasmic protein LptC n=1 Tax=Candidatus Devosia phytovorans TaxID=3121372 RepID=A0AAJ5VSG9_9HYPH|nr:hypothetical protein [Devosia sp.]WEK03929.1 MAG: hypothetical protein P0Y65_17315 [Devosia sp.]